MISIPSLIACGIQPTQARLFADPLRMACMRFDITARARMAALIGQLRVESQDFRATEENLFYTSPERIRKIFPSRVESLADAARLARNPKALANKVYAGKNGNGGEDTGDGFRYRGRGLLQLTGRSNYADAAIGLARNYVAEPDLVALPPDACLTACWYWHNVKANTLADANLIDEITRAINGRAMLHADLRRQYTEAAFAALAN